MITKGGESAGAGRKARRHRHVAARREHDLRRPRAQQAAALPQGAQQQEATEQQRLQSFAAQPAEVNRIEVDAVALDQAALHAGLRSEPADRPATPAQRLGHRETRHHVPTCACGHDDEMAHGRPPRIAPLAQSLCLRESTPVDIRPAGAGMGLRRNRMLMRDLHA